jgi:lipoprotein-releasing system permease protein
MNWGIILSISKTHLLARRKQSLVAAIGVTFGITMFISMVSFMTGLNDLLDGLILNRTPHIRLYNEIKASENQPSSLLSGWNIISSIKPRDSRKEIYNSMPIIEAIKADDRIYGIAPKVTTQVFFNAGNIEINGVVNGIDIIAEDKLFAFNNYMVEGNSMDLVTTNNSIILGKGVADKMLVNIGDMIQITTAKGDMLSMKVVGIFQSGLADFDNTQSYASLATTQKLLGKTNSYITDIQVKLKDIALAPEMAKEYQQLFQVEAIDIQTANSQFETGTKVRNIITYVVSIALLVVAGFGIYNILNMMIYEKMDDIAILKATGFSGKDVMYIFMSQALIIGLIGGVLGLIFGQIFTQVISQIPFETPSLPTIKTYPVHQDIKYYYIGIAFALTTTFVAGLFPARKASKIDPVEIIRGK